jgi:hypothetical protein
MQVRLLGPVDVVVDGGPWPVPGLRRMAVLATLAPRCGEVVSTGHLADVVWGEAAPATAVNTLQSHVSFLRRILGSKAAIRARPPAICWIWPVMAPTRGWPSGASGKGSSQPIRSAARCTCRPRWACGAGGRWRASPA